MSVDWLSHAGLFDVTIVLVTALLLDRVFAEPRIFHPIVGFGNISTWLEQRFNTQVDTHYNKLAGVMLWLILVLPIPILIWSVHDELPIVAGLIIDAILLYLIIGLASLKQHAQQVFVPLKQQNLALARKYTGYLVSRDTSELSPDDMARATIESMIENGHDAVIASLFYYAIGGIELAIIHRLANTLDAMWGYRNKRFNSFGWFAARMDDALGFVTGKITCVLYAMQGSLLKSLSNAYRQGNQYKSHNGGWAMAAGATALNIKLGGRATYHGNTITSVTLGCSQSPSANDIMASVTLVTRAAICFVGYVFICQLVGAIT